MSIFLGIDIGTQSVKVIAYDADRRCVQQSVSASLELIAKDDGTREQHAVWWLQALRECVRALDVHVKSRVRGVAVSGQQHGFVPLDRTGAVLAPVKLWCDTATASECEQIENALGGRRRCMSLAGNPILPGYTASKVLWLKRMRPDDYARLHTILLPHDYINFVLTGARFMEYGDASGTGWMNVRTRQWSEEILHAIDPSRDLHKCLPPLLEPDTLHRISAGAAAEFGLSRHVEVSVGGGDNMMAAIGTGNVSAGRLTVSLGTSGTLFACADRPIVDDRGEIAAFCSSTGGWLPLICSMNCTVATEQVRALASVALDEMEPLLMQTEPGAGGVLTLPFYNGERTPNLPNAKAEIHGLSVRNMTPANLLRSAMEGATFGLRYGLDAFARAGLRCDSICVTGGGATSAVWRQMVADVFDLPVIVTQHQEGAALGAALQAAWVVDRDRGARSSLQEFIDDQLRTETAARYVPDAQRALRYRDIYAAYLQRLGALQMEFSV